MDRGVRLALESGRPVAQVARDLGIGHEALRKRVRQAEADGGLRPDVPSSEEREEIRWGFNLTRVIRAPTRPPRPPGFGPSGTRNGRTPAGVQQAGTLDAPVVTGRPDGADDGSRPSPPPDDSFANSRWFVSDPAFCTSNAATVAPLASTVE